MEHQHTKHGICDFRGIWKYWDGCIRNSSKLLDETDCSYNHLDNFGKHIHQLGRYELYSIGKVWRVVATLAFRRNFVSQVYIEHFAA
jgi:hypothetical protein